uniref:Uncharacterized protein n=1 Tax=Oryza brachyantha TaxID=4533 RepID=J3MLZ1_ORYBR
PFLSSSWLSLEASHFFPIIITIVIRIITINFHVWCLSVWGNMAQVASYDWWRRLLSLSLAS